MRVYLAAALAVSLSATSLMAGTTAPLAPGKPAGVKSAQGMDSGLYWALGIGALGAVVVVASTGNQGSMAQAGTSTNTTGGSTSTF